jgi:hypothetical protein
MLESKPDGRLSEILVCRSRMYRFSDYVVQFIWFEASSRVFLYPSSISRTPDENDDSSFTVFMLLVSCDIVIIRNQMG